MQKITIMSFAALTMLFGASLAASASENERYEHQYRRGITSESAESCREADKDCGYRQKQYRNHEVREYRSGNDDSYRHRNGRRHRSDD